MKRLLFTFYLIVITITIKAAKADPTPFTIIQPDGTKPVCLLYTSKKSSFYCHILSFYECKGTKRFCYISVIKKNTKKWGEQGIINLLL